ncbi:MAG: ABC transporter ATP-binding protein [Desulfohalobiaceae bacterium]
MAEPTPPVLELQGISKSFGPVRANHDISCVFRAGTIHALLGENGAGKSTLMSVLSGRLQPDSGRLLLGGRPVVFSSPAQSLASGIGMVYQRFMLIEPLTVAENIVLGSTSARNMRAERQSIRSLSREYGLEVDPDARVFELSMGQRQRVEILKLLYRQVRVLILDEPTAVLTPPEVEALFAVLRRLKQEGRTVIFITHKLEEVLAVADAISVLRRGRLVAGMPVEQVRNRHELARLMVGREVILSVDKPKVALGESVLRVRDIRARDPQGRTAFQDVSFDIRRGEVFAVIGVAGNGQETMVQALTGLVPLTGGTLHFLGREIRPAHWAACSRRHLGYVPEDRYRVGSVQSMTLADNFILTTHHRYGRGPFLDRDRARLATARAIDDFEITAPGPDALARQLSGGNLQKVILARELKRRPRLLLAEQPTQGLDVRAAEDVWQAILKQREHSGILLVSGDLREVLTLADRIAVIFRGRIVETIEASDEQGVARIKLLMAGVTGRVAAA